MKQRFSSLDIQVIAHELNSALTNLRVSNIYDLSSRIFLFKLAKPSHRKQFLIDTGFRCHLTEFSRTTASEPSGFVTRLRERLKSRRVTSVSQVGTDRIIEFVFSDGQYHLFLEFFSAGNIILTNGDHTILALFRRVPAGNAQEEAKVGLKYTLTDKQNYGGVPELSLERLKQMLQRTIQTEALGTDATQKKLKKKHVEATKVALSQGFVEFPPPLLDHAFLVRNFNPGLRPDQVLENSILLEELLGVLKEAEHVRRELAIGEGHMGYIVVKKTEESRTDTSVLKQVNHGYEDFHPFKPRQFEGKPNVSILEFDGFNKMVDEFFSSIESQRLELRLTDREEAAKRKLEAAKREHEKRVGTLKEVQELHIRKAEAIGANVHRVQEAIDAVNGLVAQGMGWVEIARLIEMEQARKNPVAKTINLPLKLYENTITLLLSEATYEEDEEDGGGEASASDSDEDLEMTENSGDQARSPAAQLSIDIDLGLSPWANATLYYEQKKAAAEKEQKTIQSSTKALKGQEKKVTDDLKRSLKQEKEALRPARNPFWFEKYIFFISSEGYLVLGGRDVHQDEILYRRYLKKGDIFVNADVKDATPIIVKNRQETPDAPIPPGTLSQAGTLSVSTSTNWESKALMSAWWVHASQVSKTTETGELLAAGGFVVKGQKNFLAPAQLVLGFAAMFQISKESIPNHRKHQLYEMEVKEQGGIEAETRGTPELWSERPFPVAEGETEAQNQIEEEEQDAQEQEGRSALEIEEDPTDEGVLSTNPLQVNILASSEEEDERLDDVGGEDGHGIQEIQSPTSATEEEDIPVARQLERERYIPARGGRALERGKNLGSPKPIGDSAASVSPASLVDPSHSTAPSFIQSMKQTPIVRGKKGKAKKAAAKYADQDEEDRELALRLLGANAGPSKAAQAAAAKAKLEAEIEAQRQRRRAQHNRAAEAERKRQTQFQKGGSADDIDNDDEERALSEAADLSWIPALVGTPLPSDEVLAAIPICAPWAALNQYKYRAKLQPGNTKKGKAVQEILGHWLVEANAGAQQRSKSKQDRHHDDEDQVSAIAATDRIAMERLRTREAEILKTWRPAEIVNTLPVGKVKITFSGGGGGGGGDRGGRGQGDEKKKGKGGGSGGGGKGGKKK